MREAEITITTDDGTLDAFTCHPEEGGPFPAVILYMDAPGIREELRDMVRRLATAGYFVMLPNLYYRTGREGNYGFDRTRTGTDEAERQKMFGVMNTLSNAMVAADTGPMLQFLAGHAAAREPYGCVGYCMSGRFVLAAAAAPPAAFAAVASFYGVGIITDQDDSPHLRVDRIQGELYLAFASDDAYVPQEILDAMPGAMQAAGVEHRIEIYPDTGHGFAFPQRADYVKEAGERHWERLHELFDRRLRGR